MTYALHYFVLEFDAAGPIARHGFLCATDAEEGAVIAARLSGGALAYQQRGDAAAEIWGEPEILLEAGSLPESWLEAEAAA